MNTQYIYIYIHQALVGDITPESQSGISKTVKQKLEQSAMSTICEILKAPSKTVVSSESTTSLSPSSISAGSLSSFADEIRSLWDEYEAGKSLFIIIFI